jgi:ADP-ribose pyrophosphatase
VTPRPLATAPAIPPAAAGAVPAFIYGTLTDPDVLARVLGRPVAPDELEPAHLDGFRRLRAAGASYPVLVPAPGAAVDGLLFHPAGRCDILRLNHFESGEYHAELRPVRTRNGATRPAWLYASLADLPAPTEPWGLEKWRRRHLADFLPACDAWMADCPEGEA